MKSDTLLIRHLPPNLTDDEKEGLLKHFGVIDLKIISSKVKKKCIAFARFESDAAASVALRRLHQLDVMGYPLSVEFARGNDRRLNISSDKTSSVKTKDDEANDQTYFEAFMKKLNSWNAPLNFCQPPSPHIKYLYPPPSHLVLSNISKALASVPKFYTQVLHLMNRMNLPSPFERVFVSDLIEERTQLFVQENPNYQKQHEHVTSSEEESEIESDPDNTTNIRNIIPVKRPKPQLKRVKKKMKFVKPETSGSSNKTTTKPEEVFDMVGADPSLHRKIELKISGESVENIEESVSSQETRGFGLMFPSNQPQESEPNDDKSDDGGDDVLTGTTITSEQLSANRIPSRDQKHLPVFKNYQPGIPSCRLYLKNLSKQVVERDLHFIYRKYLSPDDEDQGSMFDIRLMKEGRMKGQAFVTLQNTKQAQYALNETNGFILKDKPLVVQFARSAKPK